MRVALLTYSTRPRGGVVHTLALAEALADEGADVTVYTLGKGGDRAFYRPLDPAVATVVTPLADVDGETFTERILRCIDTLRAAVPTGAYDVVHAQDCLAANAVDGACVRTVHHVDEFTTPALVECHARAIRQPDQLVCVSRAVAEEVRRDWGRDPVVIPSGVDTRRFAAAAGPAHTAQRHAWRERLGTPLIVTVGGIEPRKGSLALAEAFAGVRATHPGARLAIAGGETLFDYRDYRARFDARVRQLGLEESLTVLGPLAAGELPTLVAAADAFVLPSAKEGFGLAALEALAAGVPTVLSDLPVFREVVGDAARYGADPDELGAATLAALAYGHRHAAAGRAVAQRYSWSAAAARHVQLYEQRSSLARLAG